MATYLNANDVVTLNDPEYLAWLQESLDPETRERLDVADLYDPRAPEDLANRVCETAAPYCHADGRRNLEPLGWTPEDPDPPDPEFRYPLREPRPTAFVSAVLALRVEMDTPIEEDYPDQPDWEPALDWTHIHTTVFAALRAAGLPFDWELVEVEDVRLLHRNADEPDAAEPELLAAYAPDCEPDTAIAEEEPFLDWEAASEGFYDGWEGDCD